MAEQNQIIVQPLISPNKPFGARKDSNLQAIFSASPVHNGDLTDDERKKEFQNLVLDGTTLGGLGFNSFNKDYDGAPDLNNVKTGGGGKPASPYMPNLTSPGPGSMNAADQPEYNGEIPDIANNVEFGSGLGGTVNPIDTSKRIAEQNILGAYISGKSYLGSDGQA